MNVQETGVYFMWLQSINIKVFHTYNMIKAVKNK